MSSALYPTLAGLTWNNTKAPVFNTKIQRSVTNSELRAAFAVTPVWDFTLTYDLLRDDTANNELKTLMGFFLARQGSFDSFLYADPDDYLAVLQNFGTGDGVTTQFQLRRSIGPFSEEVCNFANAPSIYKGGVLQSANYSVAANGVVTFTPAPGSNVALTWSGTYYFRCRFQQDQQEFKEFMRQLWEAGSVQFRGSLGTKI